MSIRARHMGQGELGTSCLRNQFSSKTDHFRFDRHPPIGNFPRAEISLW